MEQLELFVGLQPIKMLHVWEEKRRRALLRDAEARLRWLEETTADNAATACQRFPVTEKRALR